MAGSSSYVILGLADMVFVGQYGSAALGAVGFGSFISSIFMSFFWGLSIAVQATVSRLKGAGHHDDLALYLNAAIFLVLVAAPVPSLVLFYYTPEIYSLMNSDPEVLDHGVGYLQWMWLSATFFGINMAFGGFWNATDRSTYFMRVVLFTTLMKYVVRSGAFLLHP